MRESPGHDNGNAPDPGRHLTAGWRPEHVVCRVLLIDGFEAPVFEPELAELQPRILGLLGVPASVDTRRR